MKLEDILKKMKLVKMGSYSVYKYDTPDGSIWTPAGKDYGKIFYAYSKKNNTTFTINRGQNINFENDNLNTPPPDSYFDKNKIDWKTLLIIGGAILLIGVYFND
jgi:hypothetical protein